MIENLERNDRILYREVGSKALLEATLYEINPKETHLKLSVQRRCTSDGITGNWFWIALNEIEIVDVIKGN